MTIALPNTSSLIGVRPNKNTADAKGLSRFLSLAGPAFMASVAYIDPGNYATNLQAGAQYGYGLLWVVISANLIAMLFQSLSAKLGIVTGYNLAELCRMHFPKPVVWCMWLFSELAAMATDIAEFLGGAIGISLLFNWPLLPSIIMVSFITMGILALGKAGFRPLEIIITLLAGLVGLSFCVELFIVPIHWSSLLAQVVRPSLKDSGAITLAVGIVGATVMPHAIYLHSGLTQARGKKANTKEKRHLLSMSNKEVVIALGLAGLINLAMVIMAAGAFPNSEVTHLETAYKMLTPLLGVAAAGFFLTSLIASGVASSAVGLLAGDIIMQGFVDFRIPVWLRRLINMIPAFIIVGMGIDTIQALIISQVVLSLTLPIPIMALLYFTGKKSLLGDFTNNRFTHYTALVAGIGVLGFNTVLFLQFLK